MTARAPWRIILVVEGPSDFRRIGVLIDHLLQSRHADSPSVPVDELRRFEGLGGKPYIKIKDIPLLARERGLGLRFNSGLNHGDGGTLRKLLQVLQKDALLAPGNIVLWARDDDGDSARRKDAEAAREAFPKSSPVLLAIASECGEAWNIAGWKPKTSVDRAKREKWKKTLGFDPLIHPESLSHKSNVPKSAKAVAKDLFDDDEEREDSALISAVESGSEASIECGLHAFHDEVVAWLSRC